MTDLKNELKKYHINYNAKIDEQKFVDSLHYKINQNKKNSTLKYSVTIFSLILILLTFMNPNETLEEVINSLLITNNDSVIAVEKIRHEIFENKNEDLIQLSYSLSEDINTSNFYRDSSTCSVFKTSNLKKGYYRGNKILGMPVSAAESFFINSFRDLEIAISSASLNQ